MQAFLKRKEKALEKILKYSVNQKQKQDFLKRK